MFQSHIAGTWFNISKLRFTPIHYGRLCFVATDKRRRIHIWNSLKSGRSLSFPFVAPTRSSSRDRDPRQPIVRKAPNIPLTGFQARIVRGFQNMANKLSGPELEAVKKRLDKVDDFIFLGGYAGINVESVQSNNITAVLNLTEQVTYGDELRSQLGLRDYLHVQVEDNESTQLIDYFEETSKFIEDQRLVGRRVAVHCNGGMGRSPTVVLAYLVRYRGLSLNDAFKLVHRARPEARPNNKFFEQLIAYEEQIRQRVSVKMISKPGGSLPTDMVPDILLELGDE